MRHETHTSSERPAHTPAHTMGGVTWSTAAQATSRGKGHALVHRHHH
ncbi:hypothetical protein [Streptomyces fagopyri]|nr:hypothetical protein [Streptomyces fagopyri]